MRFPTNQQSRRRRERWRIRRGSIYVMTLGTAMIVAVLGLAGLMIVRVQRLQIDTGIDMRNAQSYAKAALDMAWHRVQNDSSWRSKMDSGTWATDQAIGDGFYSFTATDPVDGNLTDSDYDPVVVVGVGKSGNTTQKHQMEIRALQPGIRCLEPVLHAEKNLTFDGGTVTGDRMVSANDKAEMKNSAQVYADAEAQNDVATSSGGVWHGSTTTAGTWPRQMPNIVTLYSYYTANGTTINYSDLPDWDANQIDNPGGEDATTSPWYGVSCTISKSSVQKKSGISSIWCSNRNSVGDYLAQDVTSKLESGITYYTEVQVRTSTDEDVDYTVKLKVVSTGSGTLYFNLTNTDETDDSWKTLSGTQTVTWNGSLTQAELYVGSSSSSYSYYVDDVVMRDDNAPSDVKVIHRMLLSPASNPFGFGVANSQGIYVIDCGGDKISIKNSRIVGTLVLLNQNEGDSEIAGSMHWAPAVVSADPTVTNLPALLSNKKLNLYFTNTALNEGLVNANFNPTGTKYNDSQDSDKSDTYPSVMEGLIYSEKAIIALNQPTISGVLVGHDDIDVTNATLTLKYNPLYFERNAPPGFQAATTYYILPDSYRQVVD